MGCCSRGCRLSTPGVLGSGSSSVVSIHRRLIRPHAPVPWARCDFAFLLIRNAFAVRERRGDPRDLPYFRLLCFPCMLPTLPRRSAVPSRCIHTTIPGFLVLSIESPLATPSLPAIIDGLFHFGAASFSSRYDLHVCLALRAGYDEINFIPPSEDIVIPACGATRYRTALGTKLDGRTENLPSSGLSPDQSQQLVRLHDSRNKRGVWLRVRRRWSPERRLW
jgi:hypothetical protein